METLILPLIAFALTSYLCYVKGRGRKISWWVVFSPIITLVLFYIIAVSFLIWYIQRILG